MKKIILISLVVLNIGCGENFSTSDEGFGGGGSDSDDSSSGGKAGVGGSDTGPGGTDNTGGVATGGVFGSGGTGVIIPPEIIIPPGCTETLAPPPDLLPRICNGTNPYNDLFLNCKENVVVIDTTRNCSKHAGPYDFEGDTLVDWCCVFIL